MLGINYGIQTVHRSRFEGDIVIVAITPPSAVSVRVSVSASFVCTGHFDSLKRMWNDTDVITEYLLGS